MQALRLTNSQLKARSRPNLNAQLSLALRASGFPVLTIEQWEREAVNPRFEPFFVAEYPYQPTRTTYDYRKPEGEAWQFLPVKALRRWRWDFFAPVLRIGIEIDGGSFTHGGAGGHSRGAQSCRDYLKRNEAEIDGFIILRFDVNMIRKGLAMDFIQRAIAARRQQ